MSITVKYMIKYYQVNDAYKEFYQYALKYGEYCGVTSLDPNHQCLNMRLTKLPLSTKFPPLIKNIICIYLSTFFKLNWVSHLYDEDSISYCFIKDVVIDVC